MADIAITSVFGGGGNPPTKIIITGTSSGCELILVTVECGSTSTGGLAVPGAGGAWSVEVAAQDCQCGKPILVKAACDATQSGNIVADDAVDTFLVCAGDCPQIVVGATVGECTHDRLRPVKYEIAFSPPLPVGTTGQVTWTYGGPNSSSMTFSVQPISVLGTPLPSLTHHTFLAPRPQPYSSTVTVGLLIPGIEGGCFSTGAVEVTVPGCLPCPDSQAPLTLSVDLPTGPQWCAPVTGAVPTFTATVNWPATVSNPPQPALYSWTVARMGGPTATQSSAGPSVSASSGWTGPGAVGNPGPINLAQPGIYSVAVSAHFPPGAGLPADSNGTPLCNVTGTASFELESCGGVARCPSLSGIDVQSECFDPAKSGGAAVTFTASVDDPQSLGGTFMWDFGDGNQITTTSPSVSHGYSGPGTYTVTVTIAPGTACLRSGPDSASTLVSIARCRDDEDEDSVFTCGGLRLAVLALLTAGAALSIIIACVATFASSLATTLSYVAGSLLALGLLLLGVWRALCPQQCGWPTLLFAQISIAAGGVLVCLSACCPWLWPLGVVMIIGGLGLLGSWRVQCRIRWCTVWTELVYALGAMVLIAGTLALTLPLCRSTAGLLVMAGLTAAAVAARSANCRS